nr:membrane-spanning 4-domains subfamily A member 10 [Cavia porcellus]
MQGQDGSGSSLLPGITGVLCPLPHLLANVPETQTPKPWVPAPAPVHPLCLSKSLCLAMHLVSGLCVLAGLFVLSKDLFLESPYLWPIWTPYPNPMASLQWLELALFCICWVELVLPVPTIMAAHRWRRRAAEDRGGVSPAPRVLPLELTHPSPGPPPSYEEATRGDA